MSNRAELLRALLTPAVEKRANLRLLEGADAAPIVNAKTGEPIRCKRGEAKLALLWVHELNPYELFPREEEALIRGTSSDTILRRRGELRNL